MLPAISLRASFLRSVPGAIAPTVTSARWAASSSRAGSCLSKSRRRRRSISSWFTYCGFGTRLNSIPRSRSTSRAMSARRVPALPEARAATWWAHDPGSVFASVAPHATAAAARAAEPSTARALTTDLLRRRSAARHNCREPARNGLVGPPGGSTSNVSTVGSPDGPRRCKPAGRGADPRARQALRPALVVGAERDQPAAGRRGRGSLLLGLRRQPLPRLRLAAGQRLYRPPAPEGGRRDQGAGRPPVHDRPGHGRGEPLRARAPTRGGHARRPHDVVLHERRRRGERERDQARALVHGPAQDRRPLPVVSRRDRRRDHVDGRPAP